MELIVFCFFRKLKVANPSELLHMQKFIKRVKAEKTEIDAEAMENAFNAIVSLE